VLPFMGPSTVRDAVGMGVESSGDLVMGMNHVPSRNSLYALRVVETRANLLRAGTMLDQAALDKYSFTRDAYLQRRDSQVRDLIGRGKDAEDE
jgi:phospholipid-binding lipoprotein MlaA